MLNTQKPEPLYQQLYTQLKQNIESGALSPGDRLPSERRLAANHGISRLTARKAMLLLVQEGYANSYHGKGAFVVGPGS